MKRSNTQEAPDRSPHPRGRVQAPRNAALACTIAALAIGCLFWSGKEAPLPTLGSAAAFLFVATYCDVRSGRIPNWLTLPALVLALGLSAALAGLTGLSSALAGTALGFGLLFVPWVVGWMGAGDVKAIMVLGALWGPALLLNVLWWMFLLGGVGAIALVVVRGGLLDLLRRWRDSLICTITARRLTYFGPAAGSAAASGLPFAICMALGASAYQLWGTPWI